MLPGCFQINRILLAVQIYFKKNFSQNSKIYEKIEKLIFSKFSNI